jgi:hypothetical protein
MPVIQIGREDMCGSQDKLFPVLISAAAKTTHTDHTIRKTELFNNNNNQVF